MSIYDMENWSNFLPYQSASYSQKYLRRIYEAEEIEEPLNKSYKNGYSFTYYLIHGSRFFEQAAQAPFELKPLLLFYGMVQLCKACLLTMDQDYPNTSSVLAHGVSTRKIKKQSFEFLQDTVLIQKKGLFGHMSKTLFNIQSLEGQKYQMEELLSFIPELQPVFKKIRRKTLCCPVTQTPDGHLKVTKTILNELKMTEGRFSQFFSNYFTLDGTETHEKSAELSFTLKDHVQKDQIFLQDIDGENYLSSLRIGYPLLPELLVHYLLLYNLSMITRYETEWWNDLFFQRSSTDISFIQAYMILSGKKVPLLISHLLERFDPIQTGL